MGSHKLRKKELDNFNSEYPFLEIRENKVSHDRFIVIDYDTKNEMAYHCGSSSKDAGSKLCAINRFSDISPIHDKIKQLITHPILVPVSYTHLRAHETRHDLVCRLLLE